MTKGSPQVLLLLGALIIKNGHPFPPQEDCPSSKSHHSNHLDLRMGGTMSPDFPGSPANATHQESLVPPDNRYSRVYFPSPVTYTLCGKRTRVVARSRSYYAEWMDPNDLSPLQNLE